MPFLAFEICIQKVMMAPHKVVCCERRCFLDLLDRTTQSVDANAFSSTPLQNSRNHVRGVRHFRIHLYNKTYSPSRPTILARLLRLMASEHRLYQCFGFRSALWYFAQNGWYLADWSNPSTAARSLLRSRLGNSASFRLGSLSKMRCNSTPSFVPGS